MFESEISLLFFSFDFSSSEKLKLNCDETFKIRLKTFNNSWKEKKKIFLSDVQQFAKFFSPSNTCYSLDQRNKRYRRKCKYLRKNKLICSLHKMPNHPTIKNANQRFSALQNELNTGETWRHRHHSLALSQVFYNIFIYKFSFNVPSSSLSQTRLSFFAIKSLQNFFFVRFS